MKTLVSLLLIATATPVFATEPMQRGDQMSVYQARRKGKLMPLPEILKRVVPAVPGAEYLGFDFDSSTSIYTLKFLRNGSVIWVEVDGRSGQILGRTGR
ncbi:PepSY domain-containing protein [Sphingomonas rubra]|uniref:Peptidase propeptide and YPEB domain-containing protein n=1 Tax=Sphingomonas rubra TaxID=634430 RepID=A0A1I5ST25_9SPHN|nr:PepSY domain-containing protein [Sphingomonas rubra]SFP73893.1 hypothetical protein SAMN04488241_106122 [Sphingomonas rubra]